MSEEASIPQRFELANMLQDDVFNQGQLMVKNILKKGDALSPLLFNLLLNMPLGWFRQTRRS
jgi:hypothetical protein